jgi:hypothetical protein
VGSPFIEAFFVSDSYARRIYEKIRIAIKGGTWVPTPIDDPKLSKKSLAGWWSGEYAELTKKLGKRIKEVLDEDALDAAEASVVEKLELLDRAISGKGTPAPVGDIGIALMNSLNRVQGLMGGLATKIPERADSIEAFRDACYSVGMGAAAAVENAERAKDKKALGREPESLRETFQQIVVRDVAESLHGLVGDPPPTFLLSPAASGYDYLAMACAGIDIPKIYGDKANTPDSELIKFIWDAKSAEASLKESGLTDAERTEYEAKRSNALTGLADTLRDVSNRTRELVAAKSSRAGHAVEFAMVAVEATRDALGMEHRGTRRPGEWKKEEREKLGRERAEEIRKREGRRENEHR